MINSVDPNINQLELTELGSCADLYVSVFNQEPWNDEWTIEMAQTRLTEMLNTPGSLGYTANSEVEVIGFVLGYREQWYSGKHFYLAEMCVAPQLQRSGVGSTLLDHLVRELREDTTEQINLFTMRDTHASSFYTKYGFRKNTQMEMQSLCL